MMQHTIRAIRNVAAALVLASPGVSAAQDAAPATVIRAARLFDGRGTVIKNGVIIVQSGRITGVGIAPPATAAVYDLGDVTVMPGMIDVHSHPSWYFNAAGRLHQNDDGEGPAQGAFAAAANAYRTLMAGFTTIQSVGSPEDKDLRAAIASGAIPGPRILTSLGSLNERAGTPEQTREVVRKFAEQGADVIKIFASGSIRTGGQQTMTVEQLEAACGEAKARGLRSIVHAHSAESVRAATMAGCTQIEHGIFVTDNEVRLMAEKGTYFDPQCGLVFRNYLDNRPKYEGIGNYNEAGFKAMHDAIPMAVAAMNKALHTPKLRVTMGTDAVAGAHGREAEDLVCRVRDAGSTPMDAMIAVTSLNAQSLALGDKIGTIAAGLEADIIAVDGDPTTDIEALKRVVFVMRGGKVYKNNPVVRPPKKKP
jgi:imidazolonepropionase-like amidohydrolase